MGYWSIAVRRELGKLHRGFGSLVLADAFRDRREGMHDSKRLLATAMIGNVECSATLELWISANLLFIEH